MLPILRAYRYLRSNASLSWNLCNALFKTDRGLSQSLVHSVRRVTTSLIPKWARLALFPAASLLDSTSADETVTELEENITHLIILAKIALDKGEKEKAEAILEMGIKLCNDRNVTFGMPFMYDILASIALGNGDVKRAENLMIAAIEKLSRGGTSEDNHHIINFKLRLARIYSSYKEYDLAEIGFQDCLDAQRHKITNGDVSTKTGMLYVNVLFWYGVHKIRNDQPDKAKRLLDTAYDYSGKIKGLSPHQEMVILYTLAELNVELGDLKVALMNMQNAVMLGKGIGSVDLPRCYVKLAKIYQQMSALEQAKSAAEEGVRLGKLLDNEDVVEEGEELLSRIAK